MKKSAKAVIITLFVIYCLMLVYLLFIQNGLRYGYTFYGFELFSRDHVNVTCNFVPFKMIRNYLWAWSHGMVRYAVTNLIGNIVLFMPIGYFMPVLFSKTFGRFWTFLIIAAAISIVVELIQFITMMGATDIDDVILNVCGAGIAYGIIHIPAVRKRLVDICFDKS